jgi:hypothetical protein
MIQRLEQVSVLLRFGRATKNEGCVALTLMLLSRICMPLPNECTLCFNVLHVCMKGGEGGVETRARLHKYMCMSACICVYTCTFTCVHAPAQLCMHVCACLLAHACICVS